MDFTYSAYKNLISLLKNFEYHIANYDNYKQFNNCVILRHDIDYDLDKALEFAEFENKLGVNSTYFVLLTSDFYNLFSKKSKEILLSIASMGHSIGLHFDELNYQDIFGNTEKIKNKIIYESKILEEVIQRPVKSVSMHRPSRAILESNLYIPGMINSYSNEFFKNFKYLSDSRRNWREPVEDIIKSKAFDKLHILTHAFWYSEIEIGMKETIKNFISSASINRYNSLNENFTSLEDVLRKEEI